MNRLNCVMNAQTCESWLVTPQRSTDLQEQVISEHPLKWNLQHIAQPKLVLVGLHLAVLQTAKEPALLSNVCQSSTTAV